MFHQQGKIPFIVLKTTHVVSVKSPISQVNVPKRLEFLTLYFWRLGASVGGALNVIPETY